MPLPITRAAAIYPADRLAIREVGLRDGLQLLTRFPSTQAKLEWVQNDYRAGIRYFDVGSYLPVDRYPQFADVDVLADAVAKLPGAHSSVLVLNRKGASRALAGSADELTYVISASEEHNCRNARRSREDGLRELEEIIEMRGSAARPLISVGIAMSFGCSISGQILPAEVTRLARRCAELGIDVVGLADTVGYAAPPQVEQLIAAVRRETDVPLALHFHDTRGMGIANVAAALACGVTIIDASLGGLGGCPFAPGASGNVVLEDLVFLCQSMGLAKEIDLRALLTGRTILAAAIPDEKLSGALAAAGLPLGAKAAASERG